MSRESSLIKNTIVLSFGTFMPVLVSLITTPILTGKLTTAEYGTYDLISTLASLLLPVVTLQIQSAGFRFLISCRGNEEGISKVISNILCVTFGAIIVSSVILGIAMRALPTIQVVLVILYFDFDIINSTFSQFARGLAKNKIYSVATIVQSVMKMALIVFTLRLNSYGLTGVIAAMAIGLACSAILIVCSLKIWRYVSFSKISGNEIKKLLGYSWPLVPNGLSNWFLRLSDRLVITFFLGIESNAVYAVANKIPNLLSTVNSTFTMAWQENATVASDDSDSSEYYAKMFKAFLELLAGACAVLIAATPILFWLLIKGDYDAAYNQMPILFLGMFYSCMASFMGGIYVADKATKSIGVTTIAAAVCNLLIDLLLVNVIGITAGSVSTLVSYFALTIFRMKDIQKIQKIRFSIKEMMFYNVVILILCFIFYINTLWSNTINIVISVIFAFVINRDMIWSILSKVKNRLQSK